MGPMGSGKTTVGQVLAARLQVPLRDTDSDVEAVADKAISDIFVDDGEAAFRQLERAAVRAALQALAGQDAVLSLGGGAVLDQDNQIDLVEAARLGAGVVFLDVGIADAARRIGLNVSRPLLIGNPRARWLALMAERRGTYERLATLTVLTDGLTPEQVADRVLEGLL